MKATELQTRPRDACGRSRRDNGAAATLRESEERQLGPSASSLPGQLGCLPFWLIHSLLPAASALITSLHAPSFSGSIQGEDGWGFEQAGLVGHVPAHGRVLNEMVFKDPSNPNHSVILQQHHPQGNGFLLSPSSSPLAASRAQNSIPREAWRYNEILQVSS